MWWRRTGMGRAHFRPKEDGEQCEESEASDDECFHAALFGGLEALEDKHLIMC